MSDLEKRPVAFRVVLPGHHFVTTSEDEARAMADTEGMEYEGLYLVSGRRPLLDENDILSRSELVNYFRTEEYADEIADIISNFPPAEHLPDIPQALSLSEGSR